MARLTDRQRSHLGVVEYRETVDLVVISRTLGEICVRDFDQVDYVVEAVTYFDDNAAHPEEAEALAVKMIEEEGMERVEVLDTTDHDGGTTIATYVLEEREGEEGKAVKR